MTIIDHTTLPRGVEMQIELKKLQREVGITFIFVTHDQEEALTMSDRIALMRNGRIEQLSGPQEMYDRPLSRYVADFIGETNLIKGTVLVISLFRVFRERVYVSDDSGGLAEQRCWLLPAPLVR